MVDRVRAHEPLPDTGIAGERFQLEGLLPAPVQVFVPARAAAGARDLLVHCHGGARAVEYAVHVSARDWVAATVDLGAGSGAYERPFNRPGALAGLCAAIRARLETPVQRLTLSGFSAGYGAVRAALRDDPGAIDAVLLLDGLHASYVPDGTPLASGGRLRTEDLAPFVDFARLAAAGGKRFLVSHSAVFPGTYASTTECADFLLAELGLDRVPVLHWGPLGMQQVAAAGRGGFQVLAYAGNSAPDHMDHLHALFHLLHRLWL